jgi:type IX secretion system PorP/SprF family membrane protein
MRKLITIVNLVFVGIMGINAQYIPLFSQYLSNGLVINPSYAGSREVLSTSFVYRDQWAGFSGGPVYQTISAHAPLKNDHIGVGFLFLNEKSGPQRNTEAYLNYAYRIRTGKLRLAFGLRAGINYLGFDWKNIYTNSPDVTFTSAVDHFIFPNFGAGLYLYSNSYFLGASIPYFLSYRTNSSGRYEFYHDIKNYNYIIFGGYLIDVSRDFKIKPTTLFKYSDQFKEQIDFNINFIFLNDKLWLGGGYRINEAVSGIIEVQLNPQFRIGYSFDYPNSNIRQLRYNSQEISLRYEFSYKIKASNPRYF